MTTLGTAKRKQKRKQKRKEKQRYGRLKQLTKDISCEKLLTWLRKRNCKRETESYLIATENNAKSTKPIKARTDKVQQNSRCKFCGDRDEVINHIISEWSKFTQKKYKIRHESKDKEIHRELCKKSKFDHKNKCYMYNPESFLENESHNLLWDFEI